MKAKKADGVEFNYINMVICALLTMLSVLGIAYYEWIGARGCGVSEDIFSFFLAGVYYVLWKYNAQRIDIKKLFFVGMFSVLFGFSTLYGKILDRNLSSPIGIVFPTILLSITVFCIVYYLTEQWTKIEFFLKTIQIENIEKKVMAAVICSWGLVYLAAFPGIYSCDANYWYYEFDNPDVAVSAQWSPIYSGAFYLFVKSGLVLLGSYEAGLAVFSLLQMVFVLAVVYQLVKYINHRLGNGACILTGVFFSIITPHAIIAIQTIQDAPFMACFAMLVLHITQMVESPNAYWENKRNILFFAMWGIAVSVLRNNGYVCLLLIIPFILLYDKSLRKRLIGAMAVIIVVVSFYKGPIMDGFGILKEPFIRESMTIPSQQFARVLTVSPGKLSEEQKRSLLTYYTQDVFVYYNDNESISDHIKSGLNVEALQESPTDFLNLYFSVFRKAPKEYFDAAFLQDLGLLFVDKTYPDPRMWHPYIDYASYHFEPDSEWISINRMSLFPLLDRLLGVLFGYTTNGYGGDVTTIFSLIPVFGIICKVSLYFWIIVFMLLFSIFRKSGSALFVLAPVLGYTLTVVLSPVIMYRYYAPIIFSMPIILCAFKTALDKDAVVS